MLTPAEKIAFLCLAAVTLGLATRNAFLILRAIGRGQGQPNWPVIKRTLPRRLARLAVQVGLTRPVWRQRPLVALLHYLLFAAFSFYVLVNLSDLAEGYLAGYQTLHRGGIVAAFNVVADTLSVLGIGAMAALLVRRFVIRDRRFAFRSNVLLYPRVKAGGIQRDSLIVGGFILLHVGSRWLGQACQLAASGAPDVSEPLASLLARALQPVSPALLEVGVHVTWWMALGLILLFLPYFVRSKHIHIFFGPVNWLLYPDDRATRVGLRESEAKSGNSTGRGATRLEDLGWRQVLDAYACIMCNRCQDVCPAYAAGTPLSPSALEINKRYWLNDHLVEFAAGKTSSEGLLDFALSKEAVWACTTCGACVEVCPVGNAPMLDIVAVRQALIEAGSELDPGLQKALESFAKHGNSFGQSARARIRWTTGLPFKIKDARKEPVDYLWFVGDYAAFDPRSQQVTRLVAQLLNAAGIDFGILYDGERNSGNDVRRVGEEGLFELLAEQNLEQLAKAEFREGIITTDPHSMHALRYEYATRGQSFRVRHYTQVLADLLRTGRLSAGHALAYRATYHDPCYLGRYNRVFDAPRQICALLGVDLVEMPRNRASSFCCGAGGGQVWQASRLGGERPSEARIREALATLGSNGPSQRGVPLFLVACPKDYAMYTDAVKTSGNEGKIVVRDIGELVAEAVGLGIEEASLGRRAR